MVSTARGVRRDRSPFRPWSAGQLVSLLIIDGERGWVRTGRPAHNAALAVAGALSCGRPRLVVGHRAFD
jgi:hypothetical protein